MSWRLQLDRELLAFELCLQRKNPGLTEQLLNPDLASAFWIVVPHAGTHWIHAPPRDRMMIPGQLAHLGFPEDALNCCIEEYEQLFLLARLRSVREKALQLSRAAWCMKRPLYADPDEWDTKFYFHFEGGD